MIEFKPEHQDSVLAKLIRETNASNYQKDFIAPSFGEMESWEIKEYKEVEALRLTRIKDLKEHIRYYEAVFNLILEEYGFSVISFFKKLSEMNTCVELNED